MRIIAGKHRGRRLASPSNDKIRPTTDRVRESLFSILGPLQDFIVVDGYAGTGALGLEAISRGARKVWFFDVSRDALELVNTNLETLGEQDTALVASGRFVRLLELVDESIDVVFLDPPYGSDEPRIALEALAACEQVSRDTMIVLEQDVRDELPGIDAFEAYDERRYGDTRITFLYRIA